MVKFQQMYKISALLPHELTSEVYRSSGENEADDILGSEHTGELTRSWLVPPNQLNKMARQLSTAGFRDLTYAKSIVHLMAVAPEDVIARVIQDMKHKVDKVLAMDAFIYLEDKPRV